MNRSDFLRLLLGPVLPSVLLSCSENASDRGGADAAPGRTIGFLTRNKSSRYGSSCERGARFAAEELHAKFLYEAPEFNSAETQIQILEKWISMKVDAIVVACENREKISPILQKALQKKIKVITFDSDADPSARNYYVNKAKPQAVAELLMETAGELCEGEGAFTLITSSPDDENCNAWAKFIEADRAKRFPKMKLLETRSCEDMREQAQLAASTMINSLESLRCIISLSAPATPAIAEAVHQAGKKGEIKVVGIGLPSENKAYVKNNAIQAIVSWNAEALGYLAIHTANATLVESLTPDSTFFKAGRIPKVYLEGTNVLLGDPYLFTRKTIGEANY